MSCYERNSNSGCSTCRYAMTLGGSSIPNVPSVSDPRIVSMCRQVGASWYCSTLSKPVKHEDGLRCNSWKYDGI